MEHEPRRREIPPEPRDGRGSAMPLCVDLDGTLVATDTLWESVVRLLRRNPLWLVVLPLWLLGGRASFKRRVAARVSIDPAVLPYRREVLELIESARDAARPVLLVTAADRDVAERIAAHLGLFDGVVASDGRENLKGEVKRDLLVGRFGEGGFEYVGDAAADLPVLAAAARGWLCAPAGRTAARAGRLDVPVGTIGRRRSPLLALVRALRPHQWAKNTLLFLPVVLADEGIRLINVVHAAYGFAAFCLVASAGYVLNDLVDVDADRAHRTKRHRPFASGDLPIALGPPLFAVLVLAAFAVSALLLPGLFAAMLAVYFAASLAYTFYLKSKVMVDVLVLAMLYTHRVLSGGVATGIPISAWLLAFSMFFFLSLAFAKRYVELLDFAGIGDETVKSRGYQKSDLEMVGSMGPASGYLAVLIFSLYINSPKVATGYSHPSLLWIACPILLYWISRIWIRARRRKLHDDPVRFALFDPVSWICGALVGLVVLLARLLPAGQIEELIR
ncbi:MAG: UbiA family prenyltransferase [Acidobacteriota bacterium]